MNKRIIYTSEKIFTGSNWLEHHAVIEEDNRIVDIVPASPLLLNQQTYQLIKHNILIPAFIDIQIYGAYGKLLSAYPEAGSLTRLYDYCSKNGTLHFMPTIATNTYEVMFQCIDAVRVYWRQGGKGCLGLHLEGTWINPVKRGAHIESLIHPPSLEEVKVLLNYGKDVIRMITLAPEVCDGEVIELIRSHKIIISAGHSNATYQQAMDSLNKGIPTITHLYNAMSPLQHREPGWVGAAFNHTAARAGIIPDGYHVDFAAIKIAKQMMKERLFVITDAVTETAKGNYQHHLSGNKYVSNGVLSGSALTMAQAVKNLVLYCGIGLDEALRMCSLYPAQVLGLKDLGRLNRGYQASFTELDEELTAFAR
jgi:N-acetylglucosamine-6-phosphate deacetylase